VEKYEDEVEIEGEDQVKEKHTRISIPYEGNNSVL